MKHERIGASHRRIASDGLDLATSAQDISASLRRALTLVEEIARPPQQRTTDERPDQQQILELLRMRRMRSKVFEGDLFADPAWDMLLELYASELGQCRISIGSLCIGAAVPATTALRWIKLLEQNGMLSRIADPMDGRRVFVSLSPTAVEAMDRYFRMLPAGALPMI